ncbi:ATP-binding protein [Streptomyces sp. S07_1.15]|uniref:ATP-binding protein n=1 Tax=Streptomyces sp. S07_1.15 TaxID=2873925 RepID=UPI001D145F11|nr:ATP-binding protein [Streptomyces sp. S07_1.15]MCC3653208.1 ATP-binding protein [Streptomyces sp. S07_1.15]
MHEYTSSPRVWGLICPGFPEEVSRARRWTRDILKGSPCADDAELIVSELSANAVLHTASGHPCGSFHLALAVWRQVIALSVTDAGGTASTPKAGHPSEDAVHGRGLAMVTALAHRVVIHDSHQGRTVTAELFIGLHPGELPC